MMSLSIYHKVYHLIQLNSLMKISNFPFNWKESFHIFQYACQCKRRNHIQKNLKKMNILLLERFPLISGQLHSLESGYHEIVETVAINSNCSSLTTSDNQLYVSSKELAKKWAIRKSLAKATVKVTTQKFIWATLHPIDRRYDFGFGKVSTQKLKPEAGVSLQKILQAVGIHRQLHTDISKDMTLGTWAHVSKDAGKPQQQRPIVLGRIIQRLK